MNPTSPLSQNTKRLMLDRLRKGGLPHVDAFIDDDEHVITDSDDYDAFIDLEAFIDDEE